MTGYACVDDLVCAPIQEVQCADAACPEGSVEDPFAWCSCITLDQRDQLFCEPSEREQQVEEVELEVKDKIEGVLDASEHSDDEDEEEEGK